MQFGERAYFHNERRFPRRKSPLADLRPEYKNGPPNKGDPQSNRS